MYEVHECYSVSFLIRLSVSGATSYYDCIVIAMLCQ